MEKGHSMEVSRFGLEFNPFLKNSKEIHVPDGDHTVCGYPALQFQEEIRFHLFFRETAYLFRHH